MLDCKGTAALLRRWDDILILSHQSPDGDTLGCAAALLRALSSLGKRVDFRCADPVPEKFRPLFQGLALGGFEPAYVVTVDVADAALLGSLQEAYEGRIDLAIDHHASHRSFAKAAWVEGDSAAAAELVWQLIPELGAAVTPEIALCVYTGVATDTGCFRYSNTTARSHQIAAQTMAHGIDAAALNRRYFETKSRAQFAAEQREIGSMELFCQGKCTLIREPLSLFQETGAKPEELDGSVAALSRQIEGVLLGVTLKERENGDVKVSVRSNPPANAAALCEVFGGGGHVGAAGCTLRGKTMDEAAELMKAACERYLLDARC